MWNTLITIISITCYLIQGDILGKYNCDWFLYKIFQKQGEITKMLRWIEAYSVKVRKGRIALGVNQQWRLVSKPLVCKEDTI